MNKYKDMGKVLCSTQQAEDMKVCGRMIFVISEVMKNMPVVMFTLDSFSMEKHMDTEFTNGQTEMHTMDNGIKV